MKKILLALATISMLAAAPAQADGFRHHGHGGGGGFGGFVAPLLLGGIIGYEMNRPQAYPAPVIIQQAPVYVNPNPYGVQPNPYLYANPPTRYCEQQDVYNANGVYLGRQQICN